jgi:hypothetical protein
MNDTIVADKVNQLKTLTENLNTLMAELEELNVEVRFTYVESRPSEGRRQGINLWRVIEHYDYLK